MKVRHDEGVATRIGPEPRAVCREAGDEASAGEHTGRPLSRERFFIPGADAVPYAEGNTGGRASASTRSARESVSQALERVRTAARQRKKERFTALFHHINVELLRTAFFALKRDAAPGIDGLTWQDYEADLDRRIGGLHERVQRGAYRPGRQNRPAGNGGGAEREPLAV